MNLFYFGYIIKCYDGIRGSGFIMSSLLYSVIEKLLWISGVKKMFEGEGEKFYETVKKASQKRSPRIPSLIKLKYNCKIKTVEKCTCLIVNKKDIKPKRAVLYLFGGGYIMPPNKGDFKLAAKIAAKTESEVWLPFYPLAPKYKLIDTVKMVTEVYKEMLEKFDSKKISFLGFSSGASLACSICAYNKKVLSLPMPNRLILSSPGMQIPPSETQMERMKKLSSKDPILVPSFFKQIDSILADNKNDYLLSPVLNDWSGFPEMIIYYGTHEVMSAFLPDVKKVAQKSGTKITIHLGEGMMHCWPMLGFTREGKESRHEIFKAIIS